MKRLLLLLVFSGQLLAQAINCPSGFNQTAFDPCSVSLVGFINNNQLFNVRSVSPVLSGSALDLIPGGGHVGAAVGYQNPVNVQAFTATFTFVNNNSNVAFVLQNNQGGGGCPGTGCQSFSGGAGSEGGFSQSAGGPNIAPDHVFALMLDNYQPLTNAGSFTYSSVQWYEPLQVPLRPTVTGGGYLAQYPTTALSTSPVALAASQGACFQTVGGTCDTYSVTVTYDGYTLTLKMFDSTAGGSCPGGSCFTQTWTGVYIPAIVGSTTAYPAISAGTSFSSSNDLLINSLVYTVNTPTGSPSFTAWNANSTYNNGTISSASPVYSVAPSTYASTQSVSITTSTTPHNYICYVLSATPLTPASSTLYPHPDNNGGCAVGTLYTGAVSITSTSTLYAMAGSNNQAFGVEPVTNPTGLGPPSTLVAGTYTITGGVATSGLDGGKLSGGKLQ